MDEHKQTAEPEEQGYEPPVAEDVDTEVTPAATAAGAGQQTQLP